MKPTAEIAQLPIFSLAFDAAGSRVNLSHSLSVSVSVSVCVRPSVCLCLSLSLSLSESVVFMISVKLVGLWSL